MLQGKKIRNIIYLLLISNKIRIIIDYYDFCNFYVEENIGAVYFKTSLFSSKKTFMCLK